MTTAWRSRPMKRDGEVPVGLGLLRTLTDEARAALLDQMKADLDR
jgi:hypothetical protein